MCTAQGDDLQRRVHHLLVHVLDVGLAVLDREQPLLPRAPLHAVLVGEGAQGAEVDGAALRQHDGLDRGHDDLEHARHVGPRLAHQPLLPGLPHGARRVLHLLARLQPQRRAGLHDGRLDGVLDPHLDAGDVGTGAQEQPLVACGAVRALVVEVADRLEAQGRLGRDDAERRGRQLDELSGIQGEGRPFSPNLLLSISQQDLVVFVGENLAFVVSFHGVLYNAVVPRRNKDHFFRPKYLDLMFLSSLRPWADKNSGDVCVVIQYVRILCRVEPNDSGLISCSHW
mmetsp:Transcript_37376/g.99525  ORF Transcript_37376/g.99525 Transcript_37376/m.99525 type:complete len:284 (+) Transcript_37376:2213-3064(+)